MGDFIVKIGKKFLFLISRAPVASQFLNHQFLVLRCCFNFFSSLFIGIEVELSFFFQMDLVQKEMSLN